MTNPIIDKTYFDDVNEEFGDDYVWYVNTGMVVDDLGNQKNTFTKTIIKCSLQPKGNRIQRTQGGVNVETRNYELYCKSIYRINVNDFIYDNNDWLIVNSVQPCDKYGVRQASLSSANPAMYKDLLESVKALNGEVSI